MNELAVCCVLQRMSWRHGWEVFRGESFQANDLVFAVEQGRRFQIKVTMKLFSANNSEKRECDYRVEGSFLARSLKVYKGDFSQVVVAEMVKKKPASSIKGKNYVISVDPNEDRSLIIVLLVIRHEMFMFRIRRMNLYTMAISSVIVLLPASSSKQIVC
uniref:Uncharacterized protein n=1 Tax=Avena sativa TaxID=4498 RepID=A0ACD5TWR0_AVESA